MISRRRAARLVKLSDEIRDAAEMLGDACQEFVDLPGGKDYAEDRVDLVEEIEDGYLPDLKKAIKAARL